jgi:hypothetical protein
MDLRIVPRLLFVEDKSVKGSVRVSRLIAEALAEGEKGAQGGPDGIGSEPADDEENRGDASLTERRVGNAGRPGVEGSVPSFLQEPDDDAQDDGDEEEEPEEP